MTAALRVDRGARWRSRGQLEEAPAAGLLVVAPDGSRVFVPNTILANSQPAPACPKCRLVACDHDHPRPCVCVCGGDHSRGEPCPHQHGSHPEVGADRICACNCVACMRAPGGGM